MSIRRNEKAWWGVVCKIILSFLCQIITIFLFAFSFKLCKASFILEYHEFCMKWYSLIQYYHTTQNDQYSKIIVMKIVRYYNCANVYHKNSCLDDIKLFFHIVWGLNLNKNKQCTRKMFSNILSLLINMYMPTGLVCITS